MFSVSCLRLSAAACLLAAPTLLLAAEGAYPERNVSMVVAFAPGGITDTLTRLVAAELGKDRSQAFVVENRAGAGGQVGTEYMKRQAPDGHSVLVAASGFAMAPAQKKVGYDPIRDFEPVALLGVAPNILVVHPSVPATDLASFVAWGKAQGSVPYASAGTGGANHLAGEVFKSMSGTPMLHVPYKGAAPAASDLIAGTVPAAFIDAMTIGPFIKSGQARPIAITGASRSDMFPDVPTIAESGYPGYDVSVWMGVFVPAGTSPDTVAWLNREIRQALGTESVSARLKSSGIDSDTGLDAEGFKQYVHNDVARWQRVMEQTGIKFD